VAISATHDGIHSSISHDPVHPSRCVATRECSKRPHINFVSSVSKDDSDDDLNDEDIPSFGGVSTPLLPTPDKGKGRAPQNLPSPGLPPPPVSGNIGTPGNAPRNSTRQSFGGVNVETRYVSNRLHVARFPFLTEETPLVMLELILSTNLSLRLLYVS
jgi:hypothetical protein